MTIEDATKLVSLLATASALPLAWRRPGYRPVAALLALATLSGLTMPALAHVVAAARDAISASGGNASAPLSGVARAAGHAHQALFMAATAAVAALAAQVFQGRRAWLVGIGWAAAVFVLVVGYHSFRGLAAQRVYLAVELLSILVSIGSVVEWTWRRRSPHLEHVATLLIVGVEVVASRTFSFSVFSSWSLAQVGNLVLYSALGILHGGGLWTLRSSRTYWL